MLFYSLPVWIGVGSSQLTEEGFLSEFGQQQKIHMIGLCMNGVHFEEPFGEGGSPETVLGLDVARHK